ncbi:hypothetical protein CKS_5576 [Pantoea stewartii subsp. stewartii DC283]|uniref:Uncharacterized protein n=1 Tax=Pantoea stewartii subsp. stewartii DC283 TaxID=660596 RepID=H3RLK2_PANSE|nr:hypothetical protein CKS_5576 [Pantoea stewartii subsp. stewartii DC283]
MATEHVKRSGRLKHAPELRNHFGKPREIRVVVLPLPVPRVVFNAEIRGIGCNQVDAVIWQCFDKAKRISADKLRRASLDGVGHKIGGILWLGRRCGAPEQVIGLRPAGHIAGEKKPPGGGFFVGRL